MEKPAQGSESHTATTLTSADGGKVVHVLQQPADSRAGTGVEPIPADAQVELQPADFGTQREQRSCSRKVELLLVELVSPGREWARGDGDGCRMEALGAWSRAGSCITGWKKPLLCQRFLPNPEVPGSATAGAPSCPTSSQPSFWAMGSRGATKHCAAPELVKLG